MNGDHEILSPAEQIGSGELDGCPWTMYTTKMLFRHTRHVPYTALTLHLSDGRGGGGTLRFAHLTGRTMAGIPGLGVAVFGGMSQGIKSVVCRLSNGETRPATILRTTDTGYEGDVYLVLVDTPAADLIFEEASGETSSVHLDMQRWSMPT